MSNKNHTNMRKTNVKSSAIPPQEDIDSMSLADILESVQKDENSQLDFSNLSCEAVPSKANGQHNDVKNSSSDVSSQKPAVVQITSKSSSRPSAKHKAPSTPEVVPTKLHSSEITHLDALSQLLSSAAELKSKKQKEKQVWLSENLYRKIEMLNIKHGKKVPTKHLINALIQLGLDQLK